MHKKYNNQNGIVLIFTVLAIGVAGFLATVALLTASLSSTSLAGDGVAHAKARDNVLSCSEEVLAQLVRDNNYNAESVYTGSISCTLSITTISEFVREFTVSNQQGSIVQSYTVRVDLLSGQIIQVN